MRNHKLVLLLIILAKFCLVNFAQDIPKNTGYLKGQLHFGYIMQHRNTIGHLIEGHVKGLELNWAFQTKGNKVWHHENNFPEAGFAMHVYSLANPQQLGQLIALAPYYDIGLNEKNKTTRLHLRLSFGVSYSTKFFDPILNHKNNIVSTPINAFVNFKWYYKFQLSKSLRLDAGLNFVHASNGRFKTPNLGINMLGINSGLTYCFNQKNDNSFQKIDSSYLGKSKHELFGILSFGITETEPPGGPKYLAQSYSLGYYFKKRNTHKFGGGIDFFYSESTKQELFDYDSVRLKNNFSYIQVGARFSYSYVIGNLSLPVEFGHYLYTRFKGNGMFYHRIGLRYQFKNRIIATFALKTHWAVAHYFEYGIGYRFR